MTGTPIDTTATDTTPAAAPVEEPEGDQVTGTAIARAEAATPAVAPSLGDLPVVPAYNELQALAQLAVTFSATDLVPVALRDKPNDTLLVLMTARDLGLPVTVALRECHPINGRVTASPKLRLAMVRSKGLGKVWADPDNDEYTATWWAERADSPGVLFKSTVTWKDGQRAGLAGTECTPDAHKPRGCPCKDNWRMWPARMLSARALGFLMDDAFGEVGTGMYDADSLGAITNADGEPVLDVDEVDPFPHMARPRQDVGRSARRRERRAEQATEDGKADPAKLADLRTRILALPEPARADLVARWVMVREGQSGPFLPVGPDGKPASGLLDAAGLGRARALLTSIEGDVRRGKYQDATSDGQEAPQAPEEGGDDVPDPFEACGSYEDVMAVVHGYPSPDALREQLAIEGITDTDPTWDLTRLAGELAWAVCERLGIAIPEDWSEQVPAGHDPEPEPDPAADTAAAAETMAADEQPVADRVAELRDETRAETEWPPGEEPFT